MIPVQKGVTHNTDDTVGVVTDEHTKFHQSLNLLPTAPFDCKGHNSIKIHYAVQREVIHTDDTAEVIRNECIANYMYV